MYLNTGIVGKHEHAYRKSATLQVLLKLCRLRGRQRAILAYEISWFLFDFPVISLKNDVICCKVGRAGGLGWFPSLISRKSALISHDFNLISTDFSTRCTRFLSLPTPRCRLCYCIVYVEPHWAICSIEVQPTLVLPFVMFLLSIIVQPLCLLSCSFNTEQQRQAMRARRDTRRKKPSLFTYNTCTIDAQYQYVQREIVKL